VHGQQFDAASQHASRAREHSPTLSAVSSSVVKCTYCLLMLFSPCSRMAAKNVWDVPWKRRGGTSDAST